MTLKGTTIYNLCQAYLDTSYISADNIMEIMGLKKSIKTQLEMEKIRDAYFDNVVDVASAYSDTGEDLDKYAMNLYYYLIDKREKQVSWVK